MAFDPTPRAIGPRFGINRDRLVSEKRFDIRREIECLQVTIGLHLRQSFEANRFQRLRNRRVDRPRRLHLPSDDCLHHFRNFAATDRLQVRQNFVEDSSQRIDIAASVEFIDQALCLFRRHISRSSHDLAHQRFTPRAASVR